MSGFAYILHNLVSMTVQNGCAVFLLQFTFFLFVWFSNSISFSAVRLIKRSNIKYCKQTGEPN